MIVGYNPMYPKLIGKVVKVMGPKGLALFAKDTGVDVAKLERFAETGDIAPIAEHIPVMWGKLFGDASPLQAAAMAEKAANG